MTVNEVFEGQRVKLAANEEEGWDEEVGVVEGVDHMPWGLSITVRLDEEYRHSEEWGSRDDGIREITGDQIEEVLS